MDERKQSSRAAAADVVDDRPKRIPTLGFTLKMITIRGSVSSRS